MSQPPFIRNTNYQFQHDHDIDLLGAQRYAIQDADAAKQLICQVKNEKMRPILIVEDTIDIGSVTPIGLDNLNRQRVIIPITYITKDGVAHVRREKSFRYDLNLVLGEKLTRVDHYLEFRCSDYSDFGILAAILDQTGVHLTLEDVEITERSPITVLVEAQNGSLGWYGEVYLRSV